MTVTIKDIFPLKQDDIKNLTLTKNLLLEALEIVKDLKSSFCVKSPEKNEFDCEKWQGLEFCDQLEDRKSHEPVLDSSPLLWLRHFEVVEGSDPKKRDGPLFLLACYEDHKIDRCDDYPASKPDFIHPLVNPSYPAIYSVCMLPQWVIYDYMMDRIRYRYPISSFDKLAEDLISGFVQKYLGITHKVRTDTTLSEVANILIEQLKSFQGDKKFEYAKQQLTLAKQRIKSAKPKLKIEDPVYLHDFFCWAMMRYIHMGNTKTRTDFKEIGAEIVTPETSAKPKPPDSTDTQKLKREQQAVQKILYSMGEIILVAKLPYRDAMLNHIRTVFSLHFRSEYLLLDYQEFSCAMESQSETKDLLLCTLREFSGPQLVYIHNYWAAETKRNQIIKDVESKLPHSKILYGVAEDEISNETEIKQMAVAGNLLLGDYDNRRIKSQFIANPAYSSETNIRDLILEF